MTSLSLLAGRTVNILLTPLSCIKPYSQLTLGDTQDDTKADVGDAVTFIVMSSNIIAPIGPTASLSVVEPATHTMAKYIMPVIMMARNVPLGIAFWGS